MSASAFPPEITESILRFLPAKSLGQFKSVSKTWNSLISHPQFIQKHLQTTTKSILVFITKFILYSLDTNQLLPYLNVKISDDDDDDDDDIPATLKELSFQSPPIRWEEVYGSCNGLILAKDVNDFIYLINPTTQELWNVPLPPFALPGEHDGELFVRYGFGYDSFTGDYKVVSISFSDLESEDPFDFIGLYSDLESEHSSDSIGSFVSVYSLCNNSWRKLPNSPYDHAAFDVVSGVFVNQNFHWLASSSMILAFSFVTEEFNEIMLPVSFENDQVVFYNLVDIGGKLGAFGGIGDGDDDMYELWVMEDYGVGDSWCRVCCHEFGEPVRPLCLVGGSNRDIMFDDEGDVFVFNIDERRCRNVRIERGLAGFAVGGTYVESLQSPKPSKVL